MPPTSAHTWTLRFKNSRTTILLHADPLTPLSTIQSNLLLALKDTKPNGLNGKQLPKDYNAFRFAKPINPLDASEGWESIDPLPGFEEDETSAKSSKAQESTSIRAIGVKDNAVIAFKWVLNGEEEEEDMAEWDVVFPSFEDNYHVENEGDAGIPEVPRDFKG